jgi:hypothetical protein
MADVKFEYSKAGFNAVRNSPQVQAELMSLASGVASRAGAMGSPCNADIKPGRTRAHARVATNGVESAENNVKTNALLKALGGR